MSYQIFEQIEIGDSYEWFDMLVLPASPWLKPFIPLMGLPEAIVEKPEAISGLAEQFNKMCEDDMNGAQSFERTVSLEAEEQIICDNLIYVLEKLESRTASGVGVAFERWARRNYINNDIRSALDKWWTVLFTACGPSKKYPIPDVIKAHLAPITSLMSKEEYDRIYNEIVAAAPPATQQEEKSGWDYSPLAALAEWAICQEQWTIPAIDKLVANLVLSDKEAFLIWADDYYTNYISGATDFLPSQWFYGAKFWRELPTIFENRSNF